MSRPDQPRPASQNRKAINSTDSSAFWEQPISRVKVERDRQEVTVEGFRTLGIVSTFIAGVESQCLGVVSVVPDHPRLSEAASALLLIGLLLSSFGAALSLLSARWFDLLRDKQITMLEYRWDYARNNRRSCDPEKQISIPKAIEEEVNDLKWNLRDYLVAKTVNSALIVVFWSGICVFARI
ncbi:hypothetical protein FRC11_006166 [Ceratobasidium sp. 423]|nr:hypothetical protein FRC11_006166 [Ceratobasidium sp. 423]